MRTNTACAKDWRQTSNSILDGDGQDAGREEDRDDQRVIIVAPVGKDASAMAILFNAEGFETHVCEGVEECAAQIRAGAGALVFTEEAFNVSRLDLLIHVLKAQPAWSELPIIILTNGGESRLAKSLAIAGVAAGTVTLLERPTRTRTLIRSVEVALRSRRRQYQARHLFIDLEKLNGTLEQRVALRSAEAIERAEQIRALSRELLRAEETERRRIAHVLHEDLQQLLMAARINFALLLKTQDADKRESIATEVADVLERAFNLTRTLSVQLAPPMLFSRGLPAALEWLVAQTRKYYALQINIDFDSSANPEETDVRTFLFRAVHELLLNAVKHAPGKPVRIKMERVPRAKVKIVVADEGHGFDPKLLDGIAASGFGLVSIRQRALSCGVDVQIDSAPGYGTRVTLLAPCGHAPSFPRKRWLQSKRT